MLQAHEILPFSLIYIYNLQINDLCAINDLKYSSFIATRHIGNIVRMLLFFAINKSAWVKIKYYALYNVHLKRGENKLYF